MAEGDTSCSGKCCTYDSSEETRHVSLHGRVQASCISASDAVHGCNTQDGSTLIMHSSHRTHLPREYCPFGSPPPAIQHCTRRLSAHSNRRAIHVAGIFFFLLLLHPMPLDASQDLSSPTVLYGLPDVVAVVGQPFYLTIPEDAFSGHVVTIEITALGAYSLPEWLTFDPDERTLLGLPLRGDEKSWLIQVRAYGEQVPVTEHAAEDEENFAECVFQLEVVSERAFKSNKQALAMFDKNTFRLPPKKTPAKEMFTPTTHKPPFCDENAKSIFWAGLVLSTNFSTVPAEQRLAIMQDLAKFFDVSSGAFLIGKDLSGPVVKASSDVPNARISSSANLVSFPIACNSFDPSVEPYSSLLHRLNVCLLECQLQVSYIRQRITVHQWVVTNEKIGTGSQWQKNTRQRRQALQGQLDEQSPTNSVDIYFVFTTALTEDFTSQLQSSTLEVTPTLTSSSLQLALSSVPMFTSFLQPSVEETAAFSSVFSSGEEAVSPASSFVPSSEEETPTFSSVASTEEETVTPTIFPSEVPSSRVVPTSLFTLTELPSSSELELSVSMPVFVMTSEPASPSVVATDEPTPVLPSLPSSTPTPSSPTSEEPTPVLPSSPSSTPTTSSPTSDEPTPVLPSSPSITPTTSSPTSDEPTPVLPSLPSSTPTTSSPTSDEPTLVLPSLPSSIPTTSSRTPDEPTPVFPSLSSTPTASFPLSSLMVIPSPSLLPSTTVSISSSLEQRVESSSLAIIPSPSPSEEETPSFAMSSMDISSVPVIPPESPSFQESTVPEETFTVESSAVTLQTTSSTLPPLLTLSAFASSASLTLSTPLSLSSEFSSIEETPSFALLTSSELSLLESPQPTPSSTPLRIEPTPSDTSAIMTLVQTSLPASLPTQPVISFTSGLVEPTIASVTPSVTSIEPVSSSPVLDIVSTSSASLVFTLVTRELTPSVTSSVVLPQPSSSTEVEFTTPSTSIAFTSSPSVSSIVLPPTTTFMTFSSSPPILSPTSSPSPQPSPNTPPKLVEAVGLLTVQHGQLFTHVIPQATFMDEEDGLTSNLTLVLLDEFGQSLPNTTWVQLNGMQIEGLPVDLLINVTTVTDVNFILTAVDSVGDFAVDFLTIRIYPVTSTGFNATITVEGDYTLFRQNLSRQIEIAHLIAQGHNNSVSDIQILIYQDGSIRITYTSVAISSYNCPLQREWEEALRTPQDGTYLYTDKFISLFDSLQYSLSGQPEFQGFCSMVNATLSPTEESTDVLIPTVIPGSGIGFILFLAVIIPGVVAALTLLVIGIIAFGLYRIRRKERQMIYAIGEERAFLRRNPVILQGEVKSDGRRKRRNPYHLEDEGVPGSIVTEIPHSPPPPEFESPHGPDSPPPAYQLPPDSYYDKYEAPYDYVETNMYAR